MKTVVIVRKRWGQKYLRSPKTNKQCCLGFVCAAYGVPIDEMMGIHMPDGLSRSMYQDEILPKWLSAVWGRDKDVRLASRINDSRMPWAKKEELLKPLFKKHRINLVFRGIR
jgi:hypothetical protein